MGFRRPDNVASRYQHPANHLCASAEQKILEKVAETDLDVKSIPCLVSMYSEGCLLAAYDYVIAHNPVIHVSKCNFLKLHIIYPDRTAQM